MIIDSFQGEYFFLSNFYNAPVEYDGLTYKNNEAAFQSAKCSRIEDRGRFCNLNPSDAKRLGRKVDLRSGWEEKKEKIMHQICLSKFTLNPELRKALLATGDAILIEGNDWGDKEWGVVDGVGHNKLGKVLMQVREELRLNEKMS